MEEGLLPHERSRAEGTVDEERRLLYVGITRARKRLTMSYCVNRTKYGSAVSCAPSTFLKELSRDHLEMVEHQPGAQRPGERNQRAKPFRADARDDREKRR